MIKNYIQILLLINISLLTSCDSNSSNSHSKRPINALSVIASTVQVQLLASQEHVSGSLKATQRVKIFNQESGEIEKLPYFQGDKVNKGDILVYINNSEITAQLTKNIATQKQAQRNVARLTELLKNNLTSDYELNQAITDLTIARAEQLINQIRLKNTRLSAPFDGVISNRLYEPGDIVPLHQHILSLIDISKLRIVIQVSELILPLISIQNKVAISIDALDNSNKVSGYISRIYPTIDPVTRKGTVEVILDTIPALAKPGQLCRVTIKTHATDRLVIDAIAIQYNTQGEYVYRIDQDNNIEQIEVVTGTQFDNKVEIITGLNKDDLIVTEGFSKLRHGKKVKVMNSTSEINSDSNNTVNKTNKANH